MMHRYTNLGAVPSLARRSMERRDALLARTGPAARGILKELKKFPPQQRVAELSRLLADYDPTLPNRVHVVAERLTRQGMPSERAVERALTLSLADATIEQIKQLGYRVRRGEQLPLGLSGLGGLGGAGDILENMAQGVACSRDLRDSVSNMVGAQEGADASDATRIGFDFAAASATCPVPEAAAQVTIIEEQPSAAVPIMIGVGVLALAAGGYWLTTRKKR